MWPDCRCPVIEIACLSECNGCLQKMPCIESLKMVVLLWLRHSIGDSPFRRWKNFIELLQVCVRWRTIDSLMPNSEKRPNEHPIFRRFWWISNLLLIVALAASVASGVWEVSVREYLRGFSDAVVPEASTPVDKVEAILAWMRSGPPAWSSHNPQECRCATPRIL